jgi:feruloyl esterase
MTTSAHADAVSASPVTVIITTSPTPSAPSTELLSSVLASFHRHCPQLLDCAVIVVFDTYDHITPVARLKRAQVTQGDADSYVAYKQNVRDLILAEYGRHGVEGDASFKTFEDAAEFGSPLMDPALTSVPFSAAHSPDRRITFVEPQARLGFALAARTALRLATTPYVWLQQHDWRLAADVPLRALLALMQQAHADTNADTDDLAHPPIEYVTLSSARTLRYAASCLQSEHPAFRQLTAQLRQDFAVALPSGSPGHGGAGAGAERVAITITLPLTPLFLWLDKPHLARRAHYLARVFPGRLAVARGDFVEDTVGQRARAQMKEGMWRRWATWLYYPGEGRVLGLRHLQGRTFRGEEGERRIAAMWRERNAEERRVLGLERGRRRRSVDDDLPVVDGDGDGGVDADADADAIAIADLGVGLQEGARGWDSIRQAGKDGLETGGLAVGHDGEGEGDLPS